MLVGRLDCGCSGIVMLVGRGRGCGNADDVERGGWSRQGDIWPNVFNLAEAWMGSGRMPLTQSAICLP